MRIQLRIDGRLTPWGQFEDPLRDVLLRRLKVLCGLAVDVRHLPQDGRWHWEDGAGRKDVRVSIIPFLRGEGAVLRLLRGPIVGKNLPDLGFPAVAVEKIRRALDGPDGLFLLAGPTGCGKSTTAHTILRGWNDGSRKIITVEDPVEYAVDGIQSVQVSQAHGLSFASVLRASLRQSPNVIFVGEIRDGETAAVAVQAALTGHLVLSTLHCRDGAGASDRLCQLGINPLTLAAALRGVLSQRLVRTLCPDCRRPAEKASPLARRLGMDNPERAFQPVGCASCSQCGFRGQTVLCEWTTFHREGGRISPSVCPSFADCLRWKVAAGETTVEEGTVALS